MQSLQGFFRAPRRSFVASAMGLGSLLLIVGAPSLASAGTIADWTFETTPPSTAGPYAADSGLGSATGHHAGAATYSSPSGNGSPHSFSSNTWAIGDYYQFQVSAVGQTALNIAFDQISSSTGPNSFKLQYSTNGTTFTDVAGATYAVSASSSVFWNNATPTAGTSYSYSVGSALDGAATAYFRLTDLVTPSAGGTDRVDNVVISATPAVSGVPAPAVVPAFAGLAVAGLSFVARRRRLLAL